MKTHGGLLAVALTSFLVYSPAQAIVPEEDVTTTPPCEIKYKEHAAGVSSYYVKFEEGNLVRIVGWSPELNIYGDVRQDRSRKHLFALIDDGADGSVDFAYSVNYGGLWRKLKLGWFVLKLEKKLGKGEDKRDVFFETLSRYETPIETPEDFMVGEKPQQELCIGLINEGSD